MITQITVVELVTRRIILDRRGGINIDVPTVKNEDWLRVQADYDAMVEEKRLLGPLAPTAEQLARWAVTESEWTTMQNDLTRRLG